MLHSYADSYEFEELNIFILRKSLRTSQINVLQLFILYYIVKQTQTTQIQQFYEYTRFL